MTFKLVMFQPTKHTWWYKYGHKYTNSVRTIRDVFPEMVKGEFVNILQQSIELHSRIFVITPKD